MGDSMKNRQNETATATRELPTVRKSLHRIHLVIILMALLLSGLSLSALSMYVLRSYAENNIQLVAINVSYSAQTAVLQNDAAMAENVLRDIGGRTEFATGRIYRANRQLLADWQAPGGESQHGIGGIVARWLFPTPVSVPVMHHQQEVGRVLISGDASRVLHYLWQALLWLGGSLLLTAILAIYLAQRMHAGIIHWQRDLKRENDALTHQTLHDGLTGLANRKAFEQQLQTLLDDPQTRQQVSVLFIDGDRFKQVNDRYGHAAGDQVLMVTAQRLRARLRRGGLVARLGGDEFAVLLSTVEHEEQVAQVARDIIEAMQPPISLPNGIRVVQSLSVGVALAKNYSSSEALIAQADAAMYHIKELGGGWYLSPSYWGQKIQGLPPQVAVANR